MQEPAPLRNDCFALPPGVDWTPVEDALARLQSGLRCVVGTRDLAIDAAVGRVLASGVVAARNHPPFTNSAVDGYGFAFASLGDAPHRLPLCGGRAAAGQPFAGSVPPGQALRILTGAAVPQGVDTIVLEEDVTGGDVTGDNVTGGDVTGGGAMVAFSRGLKPGANTRPAAEDVAAGTEILAAGRVITPGDIGLLASAGVGQVTVRRRLRVAILSTGDEVVPLPDVAGAGQIPDANRPMLKSVITLWGHEVVDLGHIRDDPEALRRALDRGATEADAILTTGGASAGDEDHVSALLQAEGRLTSWRIALKPGRPLALAVWQGVPVFGLPGNPVAAFVCALIFARPACQMLAGANWQEPAGYMLPAGFAKSKKPGRREYLRARIGADGRVEIFASEGSGRVSGLSFAEGLVSLGMDAEQIEPGDRVRYIPFSQFGL